MIGTKIAIAMSGGVDSSVSAYLLAKKYGRDSVFGMTLKLFDGEENHLKKAHQVCEHLGIKHFVIDLRETFKKEIIDYFVKEYQQGKTPNPCVKCNRIIKFGELLREAGRLGAREVATGHYVQKKLKGGIYHLYKGKDETKDQSYFLYRLTQYELAHAVFPLGSSRKEKVKKIASKLKLPNIQTESQEVCFVNESLNSFLKKRIRAKKGPIFDLDGKKIGSHEGAFLYTVGQRKGLGVASKEPLYVVKTDISDNSVVLGKELHLYHNQAEIIDTNWILGQLPKKGEILDAKIRYAAQSVKTEIFASKNKARVKFLEPVRAVTPGQSVVFYKGREVLGGGIIE